MLSLCDSRTFMDEVGSELMEKGGRFIDPMCYSNRERMRPETAIFVSETRDTAVFALCSRAKAVSPHVRGTERDKYWRLIYDQEMVESSGNIYNVPYFKTGG